MISKLKQLPGILDGKSMFQLLRGRKRGWTARYKLDHRPYDSYGIDDVGDNALLVPKNVFMHISMLLLADNAQYRSSTSPTCHQHKQSNLFFVQKQVIFVYLAIFVTDGPYPAGIDGKQWEFTTHIFISIKSG